MKTKNIVLAIAMVCSVITGCKKETSKEVVKETTTFAISGMTCEIGCAKTIQSKLSKKEGVLNAKVVFKDSIAIVEFNASTTSKKDLMAFVDGIAGGKMYKTSKNIKKGNSNQQKHNCSNSCTENENCDLKTKNKADCKKNSEGNMSCLKDCKMPCCKDKKA